MNNVGHLTLTCHRLHLVQSFQSAGGVCVHPWLQLTSGSSGYSHCCGYWQMVGVETRFVPLLHYVSTLHKIQLRVNENICKTFFFIYVNINICIFFSLYVMLDVRNISVYWPTHWGSGVLQWGCVVLTHVDTSWPRTWKPGSQWKCARPPGWMSVTVTPPPSGDRGKGQDNRKAVDDKEVTVSSQHKKTPNIIKYDNIE